MKENASSDVSATDGMRILALLAIEDCDADKMAKALAPDETYMLRTILLTTTGDV
jgi:hypothetical protein